MKIVTLTLATLLLAAGSAAAAPEGGFEAESGGVFTSVLRIVVKWVFPICAAYCFLQGVIGKGVKRGEWDMAAVSVVAAVGLALFPKLLTSLFGVTL
jgi:hypothetical protein